MLSINKTKIEKFYIWIVPYLKHIDPNTLTLLSIIPSVLFFLAVVFKLYILALIFFLGCFLDLLDGLAARAYHKTSVFGAVLDSTMDRITDFLFISVFGIAGLVPFSIILPFLLCSFLVSYIRSRGELALEKKVSVAIGFMERPERLIGIFISLLLFILFPTFTFLSLNIISWGFLFLTLLSLITCTQRLWFIKRSA